MPDTTLSIQIQVQAGELKRLRKEHDALVRKIKKDWEGAGRGVKNSSDRMFRGLTQGFKAVAASMVAVKLFQFGRSIVQVGVRMEGLRNGLLAVEGSIKAAAKALKEMQEIALLPGISLSQAIEAKINLRAVKLEANLTNRAIKAMGNALAVVGKSDELTGVVLGMTQMASAGKVLQEEINQISSRIPQFRQAMKDAFGTARSEEIQKMGISVETFLRGTVEQLEKLPQVTKGAGAAISNLSNAFTMFADNIFKRFLPQFTATVDKMAEVVGKAAELIGRQGPLKTPALGERFRTQARATQKNVTFRRVTILESTPASVQTIGRNVAALAGVGPAIQSVRAELGAEFFAARNVGDSAQMQVILQQVRELAAIEARQAQQRQGFALDPLQTAQRGAIGRGAKAIGVQPTGAIRRRGGVGISPIALGQGIALGGVPGGGIDLRQKQATTFVRRPDGSIFKVPSRPLEGVVIEAAALSGLNVPDPLTVPGITTRPGQRNLGIAPRPIPATVRAPERLPIAMRDFLPTIQKFETGMKQVSMTTIQATATITNAFANMAASMENSTLRVITSVLDMITNILAAVGQGGKSGIGGALTSLGVGVGLATGVGVGFAVIGGGFIIADTISANRNRDQNTRTQTRFLRTN